MSSIAWFLSLSKARQKTWAVVCLIFGILFSVVAILAVLAYKLFELVLLVVIGAPLAVFGSEYWFAKWIFYDCIWNWILGGDINETVSSRLGKWHFFNHAPVFKGRLFFLNQLVSLWLDQVDPNHIKTSIMPQVGVRVPDYEVARLSTIDDSLYYLGVKI